MRILYFFCCFLLIWISFFKTGLGQIGFDNPSPDSSAILDIFSIDKGILIPRISTANRLAIASPAKSLIVFDIDEHKFLFYDGIQWLALNELERTSASDNVTLPEGNLSVRGDILASGNVSSLSIKVDGFSDNALVPSGAIFIWSGSIASIPTGWSLCDGTNGTPDLRERFVVGAGLADNTTVTNTSSYSIGPGGSTFNSVLLNSNQTGLRLHTHGVSDLGHNHGISTNRDFAVWIGNEADAGSGSSGNEVHGTIHPDAVDFKTTGISVNPVAASDALQAHENRPPYYALAFIMKLP